MLVTVSRDSSPTLGLALKLLVVASALLGACRHTPDATYEPTTYRGNECKNQCIQNFNTCATRHAAATGVAGWGTPVSCKSERAECYDRCRRFDRAELAASESQSQDQSNKASDENEPTPSKKGKASPEHPSQVTAPDITACISDRICAGDEQCLSDQTCDGERRRCVDLSCIGDVSRALGNAIDESARQVVATLEAIPASSGHETSVAGGSVESDRRTAQSQSESDHQGPDASDNNPSNTSVKQTFSPAEAAQICGVEKDVVLGWIESDKLRAVEIGGSYRISRSELARTWRELGGGELFDE